MTTSVEIRANHGWPVRVTMIHKAVVGFAEPEPHEVIIPAGETRQMCVHSHLDLLIHEIQPEGMKEVTGVEVGATGEAAGIAVLGHIEPITADKINL